eukprot:CAMPEP_0172325374 /NCGR_PEP_ID=MMETSP1058-20130122/53837_1 /TAXON_ID=83371 /ORGANISM="Detonula confervacea, Strain CCMP 353" /LENGTH=1269 /DNA_ID=CAMNT_0013041897 /DNA_START=65 /DNA_END=3874 /DNA_ORIENTATION=-
MPSQSLSPTGDDGGGGGTIRMEGWLNHTTSSHRNNSSQSTTAATTTTNPPSSSSSITTSILSKTVSKKKKRQTAKKNKQPRYFVLRGGTLSYYARRHDVKAKGTFVLTRGCTVGPVVYGSLDDPPSSMEVAAGVDQLDEFTTSSASVATAAVDNNHASSSKSKKKRRQFYCVQVTWPINNKPSKDVKSFFQAKAQVAAESENEAMIQQQQLGLQEVTHSFEDNATAGMNNNGNKSPILRPKHLIHRRSKSESAKHNQQPAARNTIESLPPNLCPPNLCADDHHDDNGHDTNGNNGHEQLRPALLLPAPKSNNDINHETGLHKHYKHQIEKHTRDQQKSAEELQKVMQLLSRKADSHKKTKKRVIQGTKVAAVSTAAITAGVLTAGIGLAAGLVFVGITAAAGGSGAVVGSKVLDKAWGKYALRKSQKLTQKSFHLIIGSGTYEEAMKWKMAMEQVIKELVEESDEEGNEVGEEWRIKQCFSGSAAEDGGADNITTATLTSPAALSAPLSPKMSMMVRNNNEHPTPTNMNGSMAGIIHSNNGSNINENATHYHDMTPKWVPIQGGGMALWGILGALGGGGGNLRIYREERSGPTPYHSYSSAEWLFSQPPVTSAFPTMPRFRPDVGLAGQPFPPFKASIALKANSLDAFMCLMCSGRIHNDEEFNLSGGGNGAVSGNRIPVVVPNSGQIASFRIIETMDDHMDVIHLVFRPIYLFPSWTAPRDFVLYRFWKYDDDGTYHICFDSGQHRDCQPVPGYVRGEMHSVYTIAPLKPKKKRGTATAGTTATAATNVGGSHKKPPSSAAGSSNRPNLMNEECLLSHVVQIDPRGWVPTTSSLPFLRNQGYGDAYAIMALHQMLDVKEALDSARFVAVPMDGTQNTAFGVGQGGRRAKLPRRLLANSNKDGGVGGSVQRVGIRPMQNTSCGLTRGGSGGGQQQQQIYMPTLETSESGDGFEDDDEADYDFRLPAGSSARELFSADGYHQSPPLGASSSTMNNNVNVHIDNGDESSQQSLSKISSCPPPMIMDWWAEPEANSFRVRGKTYKIDSKKVNAGSSLFRLFAADVVETDIPIMAGMCSHPKERVQLALQREREALSDGLASPSEMPPFVFAVNIALPGPPNYHIVCYYAVDDMSMIDGSDGTPSSKLCQEFIFGKDDAFRDNTFKLIPQIVEGNFMVRKTVGSTPAIMGNKIKQTYVQGERFFELMIDTGSSAVAAGVIRICNGYAKMIVVDLAFLFEGYNETTLPERVLGCVRLKNVEFGKKLRFVESAED